MKRIAGLAAIAVVACGPSVKSVTVEPPRAILEARNATTSFTATPKDEGGKPIADPKVKATWTSSAPLVASVDGAGKVTALKSGEAAITAAFGEVKGTARVMVAIPALVSVTPGAVHLAGVGATAALALRVADDSGREYAEPRATWASSDPAVARVTDRGEVTAVGAGTAIITASVGAARGESKVTIKLPDFAKLVVKPARLSLAKAGATGKLEARAVDKKGRPVAGVPIAWKSANERVARIGANGSVTAVGKGKAKVTASAGRKSASAQVTVKR